MKYYSVASNMKNRITNEIVTSGCFLVSVENEDEVKRLIQTEIKGQNPNSTCYEDDYSYKECSIDTYIEYKEQAALRHIKSYYYDTLDIDSSLSLEEYNRIKYTKENEAKALDYYFTLVNNSKKI